MDERRRFFRINDTIGLNYRIIEQGAEEASDALADKSYHPVDLKNLLAADDHRLEQLLATLQKREPLVAEALQLLNRKITMMTSYLEVERGRMDEMEFLVKHVNISACGLAFVADENLPLQSRLAMDLLLNGEPAPLRVKAVVVKCDQKHKGQFYTRVDFDEMEPLDQEKLIQYMLKRQSEQLRDMLAKRKLSQPSTTY